MSEQSLETVSEQLLETTPELVFHQEFENGRIYRDWYTKKGSIMSQGAKKWYFSNGEVCKETHWLNGKMVGVQRRYNKQGQLIHEAEFAIIEGCSVVHGTEKAWSWSWSSTLEPFQELLAEVVWDKGVPGSKKRLDYSRLKDSMLVRTRANKARSVLRF